MSSAPTDPVLSVVMPTRNQADFIRSAVASVLSQADDLGGRLELVVADGASTDDTPAILAELERAHPGQLHWVSEPDRGPADAVNKAVARARAGIVGWLNSDDMYAPGAAARALQAFRVRPDLMMVYGQGEHVDLHGAPLGLYPTRPPDSPLDAWRDGCHICQPTAFFRRDAFTALGGLDAGLRAAFDYEFWLRVMNAYPGRIGMLPDLQALSRLHASGITLRMREQVAMEALQVISRHIGPAPVHWLLTLLDELLSQHPFHDTPLDLPAHLRALAGRAAAWLEPGAAAELDERLARHRAVQIATPHFGCSVYADGWAGETLDVRLWQPDRAVHLIRLHCRHASPRGGGLQLAITAPEGEFMSLEVLRPGPFLIEIPVTDSRCDRRLTYRVSANGGFVPAEVEAGSDDRRTLAFLIDGVELS